MYKQGFKVFNAMVTSATFSIFMCAAHLPVTANDSAYFFVDCLVQVLDHRAYRPYHQKIVQLRTGFLLFNRIGRVFWKYLLDLVLELFRKHVMQKPQPYEHLYIRRLSSQKIQFFRGGGSAVTGQHRLDEQRLMLSQKFSHFEELDMNRLTTNKDGDLIYDAIDFNIGKLNLSKRRDKYNQPQITLFRIV
jgi:hypothetical protein